MRVLLVKPGEVPCIIEMNNTLEALQDAVAGEIEAIYPFDDSVALILNIEGKIIGLPANRALYDDSGFVYDIICGTFLVVGLDEENFTDLSDALIEKYQKMYYTPERFMKIGGQIFAVTTRN